MTDTLTIRWKEKQTTAFANKHLKSIRSIIWRPKRMFRGGVDMLWLYDMNKIAIDQFCFNIKHSFWETSRNLSLYNEKYNM